MAVDDRTKILLLKKVISKCRKRRNLLIKGMAIILQQRLLNLKLLLLAAMSLLKNNEPKPRNRLCRRLPRNAGWWDRVWFTYDDKRFRQNLQVSRGTFKLILARIRLQLQRQTVTEEPISPEVRLAICLYRLGKGD